jgi:rRNA maturation RNase YbeY
MNLRVLNTQTLLPIPRSKLRSLVRFLLRTAAGEGSDEVWSEISVVLTDHAGIRAVNREFLGHDDTTDVITFRYPALPGETPSLPSGEIVVNVEQARACGPAWGGWQRELALYLAHGVDHLSGADDDTPARRRRMRRRELGWLRAAHEAGHRLGRQGLTGRRRRTPR